MVAIFNGKNLTPLIAELSQTRPTQDLQLTMLFLKELLEDLHLRLTATL